MNIPEEDLQDVMIEYDKYIQEANEQDKYASGWKPVSIQEFYENDYLELLREVD